MKLLRLATSVAIAAAWLAPAQAGVPDIALCRAAIAATQVAAKLPTQMLDAIGAVESGRPDGGGAIAPWPWTINVAGAGHLFATAAEAIAAVRTAQAQGIQSIDVGCMQINLQQHPAAFATLEEAFDPEANVRYAAAFLNRLHTDRGTWGNAIAAYHSSTPSLGSAYLSHVVLAWPTASAYGVAAAPVSGRTLLAARLPLAPAPESVIDPRHVLTPAFRTQLVSELAFRNRRDVALGIVPMQGNALLQGRTRASSEPNGRLLVASGPSR